MNNWPSPASRQLVSILGRGLRSIPFVSEAAIADILDPIALVAEIAKAFESAHPEELVAPSRAHIALSEDTTLLVMPCREIRTGGLGTKLVVAPNQPDSRKRSLDAFYLMFDPETGNLKALLSANLLTDLRTAATSALATTLLAREGSKVLGVFGTGRQARAHILMMNWIHSFERILVCGSGQAKSEYCASEMQREYGLRIEPSDMNTCISEADVVCACTSSPSPLFDGHFLREGMHLNLVGAFRPDTREVDTEAIRRSQVFVESYGVSSEAGELRIPIEEGVITSAHVISDLHELLTKRRIGRSSHADITIFKSVGNALEDFAAVRLIERAFGSKPVSVDRDSGKYLSVQDGKE